MEYNTTITSINDEQHIIYGQLSDIFRLAYDVDRTKPTRVKIKRGNDTISIIITAYDRDGLGTWWRSVKKHITQTEWDTINNLMLKFSKRG